MISASHQEPSQQSTVAHKSHKIMDQIKETWMWEIFDLIDDDEDGYISPQHIDITTLPNNIIDIITPVLLEIEQE